MEDTSYRAIAIVGLGAVLPDAPNVKAFWQNIKDGRYSITEVTPDRWDPAFYYDVDPSAPDKTYSKIGGWVREHIWDPMKWRLPIPPRVVEAMDGTQKWAISCTREALEDYGYPGRPLDTERTAVILGNAMGGEKHYRTVLRVVFPEYAHELAETTTFAGLPEGVRRKIEQEFHERIARQLPEVTEDTMPGELANCTAGRIANIFNFHGPNFVTDAACASAMAAISASIEGLIEHKFDAAITGGIDRNMGASTFVKFCKIGALSATGTRPYAEGADGFVMGEGAAIFLLKRLADAERDGDNIYAVFRGMAGASDGKGKGITAPNPVGQKLCVERAWENSGLSPETVGLIEGHGTSTKVGDVVEVNSMVEVLKPFNLPKSSVALGSVKSNIGHLKAAAGAAGMLKAALAIKEKVLPPSVHFTKPNPDIDFAHSPIYVNSELKPWASKPEIPRRAGVSAFGFGGTNFHAVLEEYTPGRLSADGKRSVSVGAVPEFGNSQAAMVNAPAAASVPTAATNTVTAASCKAPLRGALVVGGEAPSALVERLREVLKAAQEGRAPAPAAPKGSDLRAPERIAIDYVDTADLADKVTKAIKALAANQPAIWKALRAQGIFRGHGPAPKVAFLYTGQGSQYVNMLKVLRATEPIVAETFAEADRVMTPLLGKPLSEFIFVDREDEDAVAKAEEDLRQTAITQPAVLATDMSMTRLLAAYGIRPDMTMGHSLGEYGALVASGAIPFEEALEAVSARGREMTRVSMADNGKMAAVFAPIKKVEEILKSINGYVVVANINSDRQSVIGGASDAVEQAIAEFVKAGFEAVPLPVSHAFHTSIVSPASEPVRQTLRRLHLRPPQIPIVANVNGEFYPAGEDVVPRMIEILGEQVAAPVQFIKGIRTLYEAGARVFVETGPKKALHGFVEDVLADRDDAVAFFSNHPKIGDIASFNQALCGLYASGLGQGQAEETLKVEAVIDASAEKLPGMVAKAPSEVGGVMDRGKNIPENDLLPVVITGAGMGLPGTERIFGDDNVERILRGDQFIQSIPERFRQAMLDKNITRLVKDETGGAAFETLHDVGDAIKLAGRGGAFDPENEFGISADRLAALDRVTQLAIAAGIDAMRDAGIPMVMRYKKTSIGTQLPDRWGLPDGMRDDTGVIFGSAFPGYDSYAEIMSGYFVDRARREQLATLENLREQSMNGHSVLAGEIDRRIEELRAAIEHEPYVFDRRFLFRTLSMGHSQFAEFIGARGPNTQINSACATTTQAVTLAEDWIRAGRCRRVIVISADDVTSDNMIEWFGAGFLASGAAATDEAVEEAAIPFDRRRHGLIMGMGAAAMVVESTEAARERGIQPICEVISGVTANSAFHGSRLDVQHISQVMEDVMSQAEKRSGISRKEIAPRTMFVSHETYTPARGGSASAEIFALRKVFGNDADQIVIANTKGFTGHAMATGIEDVVAIKALETGLVPPVANFKEVDPELGELNLSKGGRYPVEYALRLGAGFGSQISMTLMHWVKPKDGVRRSPNELGYEYRIVDLAAWNGWVTRMAGHSAAEMEVVQHTLRVRDQQARARVAETAKPEAKAARAAAASASASTGTVVEPRAAVKVSPEVLKTVVTPETVAPAISAAPVAKAAPVVPDASVQERILALAVEKTGYPKDMLDMDLDLEADLGVDTVKQAEMFAAIREIYNIPRDQNLKLRDFPTLAKVVQFVYDKRPDLLSGSSKATAEVTTAPPVESKVEPKVPTAPPLHTLAVESGDSVQDRILNLAVEKTGYPKDMLDLDLDLEADLGVDTVKQAEMFAAIREIYNIPRDQNLKLRDFPTLAKVIQFVYDKRPDLVAGVTATTLTLAEEEAEKPMPVAETITTSVATTAGDDVKERILALTVEKTGYPKDMLDLDLDLEADLGVDTVKQAEMFAAIREIYNIPRDQNLKLRDFPTLAKVIQFVYDKRPDLVAGVAVATSTEAKEEAEKPVVLDTEVAAISKAGDDVKERILKLTVEKTGYPKDMLDLDLDLEADLGVDTVKQAEMFAAIREIYNIPRDQNLKLRDFPTLAKVIQFVYDKRPDLAGKSVAAAPVTETVAPAATTAPKAEVAPPALVEKEEGAGTPSVDDIREKVLDIVAEKTGYPKDMLDVDLDLEADLGVDTVKQAEMFASVRAAYNIPREENLKLRDFPTLAHVIRFAQEKRAAVAPVKSAGTIAVTPSGIAEVSVAAPAVRKSSVVRPPAASFDAANLIPRRVPVPNLRPPLRVCKPTGVALGAGSRVVVMPDQGGVAEALSAHLKSLGVEVLRLEGATDNEMLTAKLKSWAAAGPVQGVYWLPALDNEGPLAKMDLAKWHELLHVRVKLLYSTMRTLYEQVAVPGTFLVSGTRLGGQHGYDDAGALAPMGGAVAGFTKTYRRERPDALAKVVDFGEAASAAEIAKLLVDETLRDPGAVEIGYKTGERWTVALQEQPVSDGRPGLVLNEESVFLVTGAAGSIVSAITADLARASGGTFYLLDLVPEPDANNPDLKRFVNDKDGLKRDLFARIQARGERATPALVEKELAALERAQAAQMAIDAVHDAGGTANYFSVNLTDTNSVAAVIDKVRAQSGRIDVMLHAAGIERSHFLPDKDAREFDLVFDVKSDGWFNLLHAIGDMPLAAAVAFSSIAGRFGNAGQTDYSSANDLLCKFVSGFRTSRPATRGIAIDWTAWGGIGMATRGSIPKMMELAGIDMLPPAAGVPWIRRELTEGATRGEVVVGQRLGVLLGEWDETGGLHTALLHTPDEGQRWNQGPMIGRITGMTLHRGLTVEAKLDPKLQPFLHDHQIDGTPVLPGVMGVEAFAEAAASLLPNWRVESVEDVNFLAPFKFYRSEPRTVSVQAVIRPEGESLVAECRLTGSRQLPNQAEPQLTTHFTARVRLSNKERDLGKAGKVGAQNGHTIEAADIYRVYFHGPAYQVMERAWRDGDRMVGMMSQRLPANHHPAEKPTLMAPRLIELCFQTAGLWEMSAQGRMGLPLHIDRVSVFHKPESANGALFAVVTPARSGESFDAEVVDAAGTRYVELTGYRTVALPNLVDLEPLKALQAVAA